MARSAIVVWILTLAACNGSECEDEVFQCDGNVLQECHDGAWEDHEDCDATGSECHAEMGHCMAGDTGM